jgi:hypothetical protein
VKKLFIALTFACVITALTIIPAASPSSAATVSPVAKVGINDYTGQSNELALQQAIVPLHAGWVRFTVNWSSFEPSNGVYPQAYITQLETAVMYAHWQGFSVNFVFTGPVPSWVSNFPTNYSPYVSAVTELASIFSVSGGVNNYQVPAIEIWNEANNSSYFNTSAGESAYATLLAHSTIAVNAYGISSILSGTSHFNWSWDEAVMSLRPTFNILGVHPYPTDDLDNWNKPATYLQGGPQNSLAGLQTLDCDYAPSGCNTQIWATEAGFFNANPAQQIPQSEQATGLTAFYNYINSSACNCSHFTLAEWYTSNTQPAPPTAPWDWNALELSGSTYTESAVGQAMAAL